MDHGQGKRGVDFCESCAKKIISMQNIHEKCGQGLKADLGIGKIKVKKTMGKG